MPERYAFMRDMFRIWANQVETIKLKWYQTGLFKLLTFIVTVVLAIVTGQFYLIGIAIGLNIAMKVLGEFLPPEVMAVLAVVAAVTFGDFSGLANSFATVANITNSISQVYFIKEQGKMLEQLETYKDMIEAEQEALEEMQKETLYIPFDSYTSYFNTVYDTLYNAYDGMYDSVYNFDRMLKPNAGVKI
jgi:hypothetical protein